MLTRQLIKPAKRRPRAWALPHVSLQKRRHAPVVPSLAFRPSFATCRARVANPEEHWEMIRVPFGTGIAGKVAESGTSLNIPDAYACGLFNPAIDKKTGFRTRNILCCPISDMAGNHVAVIQVRCES